MKKIVSYVVALLVISGLSFLVFWQLGENKKTMEKNAAIGEKKTVVFPVTTVNAKQMTLNQTIKVNGVFNPSHTLNFVSEQAGRILSVAVKEGDRVSKGQFIAQIDDEQFQIELNIANANLEKAKADLIKFENLLAGNAATKQQIEDLRMGVKNAESRVLILKKQIKSAKIVSPISGIINRFSLEVGSFVSPGAPIAEIIDISTLKMRVSLQDKDVINFSVGQGINIIPDLYASTTLRGKISFISAKADASRNFAVEIEVANNTRQPLKAGMTGVAEFNTSAPRSALMLPVQCIVGGFQKPSVFVIKDNISFEKEITTGYIQDNFVEILSGLTEQDVVVSTGQLNIVNGSKVKIINE